ncbi:MAG: transcriptional regulator [Pirellulaceae bacterium]
MNEIPTNRMKTRSDALPAEIVDLQQRVNEVPEEYRAELDRCVQRVVEFTQRRRRILNLVQEALGQLRLDMKYLMFDLDATRRERDLYKKALDEQTG